MRARIEQATKLEGEFSIGKEHIEGRGTRDRYGGIVSSYLTCAGFKYGCS
jgi:hypothetical protein